MSLMIKLMANSTAKLLLSLCLIVIILPLFSKPVSSFRTRNSISYSSSKVSKDYKTYFYDQTLDHFGYGPHGYATFKQKYVVNSKYWAGPASNTPIFAFLGEESSLERDFYYIGVLSDNAPSFKALQVYIEHRYYGESVPFGSIEEAMKNVTMRGLLNSAQALADYAEVLLHIKEKFSAQESPVIVFGGSYGGMLAAWFRLKYPHIALGALASSAPVLYFDNITPQNGYYSVVSKVFKETSKSCHETIKESWSEIDKIASKPNGLSILSRRFKTCKPLSNSKELRSYLDDMYCEAAQYNLQPDDLLSLLCGGIDGAPKRTDVLGRVFAGVVTYMGSQSCYDTSGYDPSTEITNRWHWQVCSEMVIPLGWGGNDSMFPERPFDVDEFVNECKSLFGVQPKPHWVTTYYGGHNIKLVLGRFGSNIIFSNGLKDPYSSGGVIENISDSILAVTSINGTHSMDILYATESDPEWLIMQRKQEMTIIQQWIKKYHSDFIALNK